MTTALVPPLLTSLIDDAAMFPPGDVPLADATPAHRSHRAAWYAPLVGSFLCRASQLEDLESLAGPSDDDEPLGVAVVVDTGTAGVLAAVDTVAGTERLVLRGVEIPVRGEPLADNARRVVAALDAALGGPDDDEPAYVEIPRAPGWEAALDVVAEAGYGAKSRTGGADVAAYPSAAELAAFVVACLDRGIAFKLTAGLHHAVRPHASDTGEHGFLNVALAVSAALDGAGVDDVAKVLDDDDPAHLTAGVVALSDQRQRSVRTWFRSFGSCSITEPLDDLVRLGLVTR